MSAKLLNASCALGLVACASTVSAQPSKDELIKTDQTASDKAARAIRVAEPDWGHFKQVAEAAVKARLIDPFSAQFEWPYGFIYGSWKPILQRHLEGYWTCGRVNARNRMGGYVGASAFVVVLNRSGAVTFVDIGNGKYDLVAAQCEKSVKMLPTAPAEITGAPVEPLTSVADELAKLVTLRDKGILTEREFQTQKAKLLGEPQSN